MRTPLLDHGHVPGYTRGMRGPGPLLRALTTPWCRALAIVAAWLLAVNALRLPLLTAPQPASCCCDHRTGDSRCPCHVCTHARELRSNKPLLKTCGPTGESPTLTALDPAFTRPILRVARVALPRMQIDLPVAPAPPDPLCEVPTPPPLARS